MEGNRVFSVVVLLFIVIASLMLLSLLPPIKILGYQVKTIDPFRDIKKPEPAMALPDSAQSSDSISSEKEIAVTKPAPPKPKADTCNGRICIEDFSSNGKSLNRFFRALNRSAKQKVRIAFFGDSFIEGDVFCGAFRDTLQQAFGGRGVGYVPITSDVAGFRYTIKHEFENWETYSAVSENKSDYPLLPSGYCFRPLDENSVYYQSVRRRSLHSLENIRLFYINHADSAVLTYQVNDSIQGNKLLDVSEELSELEIDADDAKTLRLRFLNTDSIEVYGVSFESKNGVIVDNFSMRGNSGLALLKSDSAMHTQFQQYQDYELVILQYGLNVVTENDSTGYKWYERKMIQAIGKLKSYYEGADFLLIGVSDRSMNKDGRFITIPSIPLMRDVQRRVAKRCGIAFFDMYEAMGGQNSIVKMVEGQPPLAAKDYTHLNFAGGRKMSKHLVESLLYAKNRYDKK